MIPLQNGCTRSEFNVNPSNWDIDVTKASDKTIKALIKKSWQISYRYYDPAFKDDPNRWAYPVSFKGMNHLKDLAKRQAMTRILINAEKEKIDNQLYNPITGQYYVMPDQVEEITGSMPFIDALNKAYDMLQCVPRMLEDIKCAINGLSDAAGKLYDKAHQKPYVGLKISQVSRKHIVYLFQQCKKDNPRFSANRQNKYRAYLVMLYKQLVKVEAVEHNIINDIPVEKGVIKKKRHLFTPTEMLLIDTNLKAWDYHFWRYMRIFHRSGSRSTEMFQLKPDKVSLESQEFIVLVKKGRQFVEQVRPIPDDILPLWIEVMEGTKANDYLFSYDFKPGIQQIDKSWVHRRWDKYVQGYPEEYINEALRRDDCLYIKKTFYTLKAQNTDAIANKLDLKHAAAADGHTNTTTTRNHYALVEERRELETLKKTSVAFE
jgi:integrase